MIKHFTVVVITLCVLFKLPVVAQSDNTIRWSKDRPLQWSDFKGKPNYKWPYEANTRFEEFYHYTFKKDVNGYNFTFETYSLFYTDGSWVKPQGQYNALLAHEQGHFDISEFFSRQLLIALKSNKYTADYDNEIKMVAQLMSQERTAMEGYYDDQTEHSSDKIAQKKWEAYIADLLDHSYTLEQALAKQPKGD